MQLSSALSKLLICFRQKFHAVDGPKNRMPASHNQVQAPSRPIYNAYIQCSIHTITYVMHNLAFHHKLRPKQGFSKENFTLSIILKKQRSALPELCFCLGDEEAHRLATYWAKFWNWVKLQEAKIQILWILFQIRRCSGRVMEKISLEVPNCLCFNTFLAHCGTNSILHHLEKSCNSLLGTLCRVVLGCKRSIPYVRFDGVRWSVFGAGQGDKWWQVVFSDPKIIDVLQES